MGEVPWPGSCCVVDALGPAAIRYLDLHRPCALPWIHAARACSSLGDQLPALIEVEGGREKVGGTRYEEDGGSVGAGAVGERRG